MSDSDSLQPVLHDKLIKPTAVERAQKLVAKVEAEADEHYMRNDDEYLYAKVLVEAHDVLTKIYIIDGPSTQWHTKLARHWLKTWAQGDEG